MISLLLPPLPGTENRVAIVRARSRRRERRSGVAHRQRDWALLCRIGRRRQRPAGRAAGTQRRVPLCSARAPPRWQEAQPDLTAPNAGAPVGAAARWTAPAVRLVPRVEIGR